MGHLRVTRTPLTLDQITDALWAVVPMNEVATTNDAVEHALLSEVIARKHSYGTHSAAGSRFGVLDPIAQREPPLKKVFKKVICGRVGEP